MANYGLRHPKVAKYNRSTGTYSDGFVYGKAVTVSSQVNYVEGEIYGDDEPAETVKEFSNQQLTLGTTNHPLQAASTMMGHTVVDGEVKYHKDDTPNEVGVGITGVEMINGEKKYVAKVWPAVTFAEPNEELTTKGKEISFGTPSIVGSGKPDKLGMWKYEKTFDTDAEAQNYVDTMLNINESDTPDVVLNRASLSLEVDGTATLIATTIPTGETVAWTTGNSEVATVANGVVTAEGAGSTTITATITVNGVSYSDTCAVTVSE